MTSRGFTLIEILVALSILFAVVTSGFMAFQTALAAGERANQTTVMLTAVPYIQQQVRQQLLANPTQNQGEGELLAVSYQWFNQPGPLTAAPGAELEPMQSEQANPARFRLHQLRLVLVYQQRQREFRYQELTWLD